MEQHTQRILRRFTKKLARADVIVLRLSVIAIFALFGTYKWFDFEVNALHNLLPETWLNVLYALFGLHGASYFLGAVENITLLALIAGFFRPLFGAIGAVMVMGTGVVTLSLLPELGRIDSFIIKDVLLIGAGLVLLRDDLRRYLVSQKLRSLSRQCSKNRRAEPSPQAIRRDRVPFMGQGQQGKTSPL